MFRVTYYKCRINLEVFHVLTDGMGGINFLKELTYQYLRLAHKDLQEKLGDSLSVDPSLNREDSFLKNYKKSSAKGYQTKKAYLIRGEKLRPGEFGVMHGYMKIPELKKIMGFPENYVLIGTQADQKKFIGNAVEVNMARVLCEALCKKLKELELSPLTLKFSA